MPSEHGTDLSRDGLRAWAWLPLILLLSCHVQLADMVKLSAPWLILPLALWLGQRYGRMGLAVVALGGIGLPLYVSYDFFTLPAHPDIYLAALFLAWLASRPEPLQRLAIGTLPAWALPLILGLLALSLGLWGERYSGDIKLQAVLHFRVLLYLFVFSLGLSRVSLGVALGSLIGVTLFGVLLDGFQLPRDAAVWLGAIRADLPLLGLTELKYIKLAFILDTPAEFLAATGYLLLGRTLRPPQPTAMPQTLNPGLAAVLLGLLLLGLGRELNLWLVNAAVDPDYRRFWKLPAYWRWFGAAEAIPLAAIIAGRYLGYPGLVALLAGVVAMWGLEGALRAGFELSHFRPYISLSTLLYVFGFGSLGIQIRAQLEHRSVPWWSNAWAFYLILVLIVLLQWWPLEAPLDIFWLCALFVVITGASLLVARLWQWLAPLSKRHIGWLAVISLCLLLYSVLANYQAVWEALQVLGDQMNLLWLLALGQQVDLEMDNRMLLASLTLLGLGVVIFACRAVLAAAGDLWGDLVELRDRLSGSRDERQGVSTAGGGDGEPLESTTFDLLNRWLGRLGWACVVVALLLPTAIGGQTAWQSYNKQQARAAERLARNAKRPEPRRQSGREVDSQLLAAVKQFTASWPTTQAHSGFRRTSYDIDWYQHPDYPSERLRIYLVVDTSGARRTEASLTERRQRALKVYVSRLEQGRFGLWVETRSEENRQRKEAIAAQIKESIIARAGQLPSGEL
ncbi:MAG: hypothetical protein JMN27_02275 [gamma proteobacterium endosymbiont of Lamellibrachia anaximandri]|nr:hypothetical protein [gamma proteobacterium endosymbiont of Lamellibrachia anaximandri]MBL3532644.1 hypothetical protein [gamma proteobacterium endosymbiont of Lamellibrachia anaximandri]